MNQTPNAAIDLAVVRMELAALSDDFKEMKADMKGLLEIHTAMRHFVTAMKWIAGIAASVAGVWAAWRGH